MDTKPTKRRFNWWMLAFFLALIAFEFTRELWVVSARTPMFGASFSLHGGATYGYVSASGQWLRSDGGSSIIPGTATIECYLSPEPLCIEATSIFLPGIRTAPDSIDLFTPTVFTDDAVIYENDAADCAKYTVRLDLVQKRVTATRVQKPDPLPPDCNTLEERVAMELGDGWEQSRNTTGNTIRAFIN